MIKGQNQLDIALLHHPVLGKEGEIIGSAVTNLDLHDIARTARTYGVNRYYIVTPYYDQQELVKEIIDHWQTGHGSKSNPARKEAFKHIQIATSFEELIDTIENEDGKRPVVVTTSARKQGNEVSFEESRHRIMGGEHSLLLFGTAHGLAPEITELADYSLPPISGIGNYNHLSVRAAVAIICDRLLGEWK